MRYLQAENLVTKHVNNRFANTKNLHITTIAFNSQQKMLLAADSSGNIMMFKKKTDDLSATRCKLKLGPHSLVEKYHTQLQGHGVYACDHQGSLTVLAGIGLVIIDTVTGRLVVNKFMDIAVPCIMSVQLCAMRGKVVMALSGNNADYSLSKTDVFDVTGLITRHGVYNATHIFSAPLQSHNQDGNLVNQVKSLQDQLRQQAEEHEAEMTNKDIRIEKLHQEKDQLKHQINLLRRKFDILKQQRSFNDSFQRRHQVYKSQIDTKHQAFFEFNEQSRSLGGRTKDLNRKLIRQNIIMGLLVELPIRSRELLANNTRSRGNAPVGGVGNSNLSVNSSNDTGLRSSIVQTDDDGLRNRIRQLRIENIKLQTKVETLREVINRPVFESAFCSQW